MLTKTMKKYNESHDKSWWDWATWCPGDKQRQDICSHYFMPWQRFQHWCHKISFCLHDCCISYHDDVIKWKHFPRYWPFVWGIHRWPVNSPHKGQWCGALIFSLSCALNKRLSKQSWGWWFESPLCSLWRHCNDDKCQEFVDTELHKLKILLIMQCLNLV